MIGDGNAKAGLGTIKNIMASSDMIEQEAITFEYFDNFGGR